MNSNTYPMSNEPKEEEENKVMNRIPAPKSGRTLLSVDEWKAKGESIFGIGVSIKSWRFQCPICKQSQSLQEFIDAEIENPDSKFYYSCIGRWVTGRGCDWTLGGLLQVHETEVKNDNGAIVPVFEFAEPQIQANENR